MRRWVRIQAARIFHALRPKPDLEPVVRDLSAALADMRRLAEAETPDAH